MSSFNNQKHYVRKLTGTKNGINLALVGNFKLLIAKKKVTFFAQEVNLSPIFGQLGNFLKVKN